LNQAYREQRPLEARITGFDYVPFAATRGNETGKVNTLERDRAELILRHEVEANPGLKSYWALGQLYLAERQFDPALEYLNRALALNGNDAQLENDLGAALLEKGKMERDQGEGDKGFASLSQSLTHLSRALELKDSLLEALFNRALCYQYRGDLQQAQQEWQKYLAKDGASKWADEARRNLKTIEEQPPRRSSALRQRSGIA
jgi:tetratricopeptide (TPR) repeat protein